MSQKNDDFFKEKKPWSEVKDELLGCYFKPYVSKILHTYHPLVYIDCFAGKGKFEDGKPGSPLIALDIISKCLEKTKVRKVQISTSFIDLNYADDLRENLRGYSNIDINVIPGKYEEEIEGLLANNDGWNVFLYIDPYGIKALQSSLFDNFAMGRFNSIELLININSFGFIREACHALGTTFEDASLFADLVEYDSTIMDASERSITALNEIAGGDYWQPIIEDYKKQNMNGYAAEALFAEKYCARLKRNYSYVLNMPLRIKAGQRPKYRLVHATNHRDGCLLMVDNIWNRWQALQEIQNGGQQQIWKENYDNKVVDDGCIERNILKHFSQYTKFIQLDDALADYFMQYGAICSVGKVRNMIKILGDEKHIEILRNPSMKASQKPSTFMHAGKGKAISIRWLS